jgi:alkylation response protein AidB-like acyl-CoA dehydrogenase
MWLDGGVDVAVEPGLEAWRAATAGLLAEALPLEAVRELTDRGGGLDRELFANGASLGWFDAGPEGAGVVAEERGRLLQPGPFVPTAVVVAALASCGSEAHGATLAALRAGAELATWAAFSPTGTWDPTTGVRVSPAPGDGVRLDGVHGLVPDAGLVTWLLVAAGEGDGASQLLVRSDAPGVELARLESLDLTRTLWEVRLDGVEVPASAHVGPAGGAGPQLDGQLDLAVALSLAETVGTMDQLFERTVAYARRRTAFGRPIGSFQAIKHLLADTSRLLETSKAVAAAAVRVVATGPEDDAGEEPAAEVVSMAKSYIARASIELAHACWQTFGGIAYTWEHDFHLYLRRLTSDAALYGDAAWHHERLCALHSF